jgi:hypothetical protein
MDLLTESGRERDISSSSSTRDADGNQVKIVCFPNSFKEKGSNQPDIRIYASKEEEGE